MGTSRKILIIAMVAILSISVVPIMAEDSDAALQITDAEQRENPNTGMYYLFIDFNSDINGMGEAYIPETGFKTMYNVDGQSDRSRLVLMIGDTPYDHGTYTLILTGATELEGTFDLIERVDVTVRCVLLDGSICDTVLESGSTISVLEIPEAPEGCVFVCWVDVSMNRYHGDSVIDRDIILFPLFERSSVVSEDFRVYMKNTGSQMNIFMESVDGGVIADGRLVVTFYYTVYDDFIGDFTTERKAIDMDCEGGDITLSVYADIPKDLTTVYSASAVFTSNGVSNGSGAIFC